MIDKKTMVKFNNVTATYSNGAGIFNVDFELKETEMVFLMGPTGSGKSTLLKTIYKELDIYELRSLIAILHRDHPSVLQQFLNKLGIN